ncbi:MAG: lamin tail domain-containing protein, partial [Patescibacteria group bacterium]
MDKKFLPLLSLSSSLSLLLFWPGVVFGAVDQIVINEIAWAGTAANSADEWLELYNPVDQEVDLAGWQLFEAGGATLIITLSGKITPKGYFLIERSDDNSVADVAADVFGPFGGSGLNNNGEFLVLKNAQGQTFDQIDASSNWPAGDSAAKSSMERKPDGGWQTNDGLTVNGHDVDGLAI